MVFCGRLRPQHNGSALGRKVDMKHWPWIGAGVCAITSTCSFGGTVLYAAVPLSPAESAMESPNPDQSEHARVLADSISNTMWAGALGFGVAALLALGFLGFLGIALWRLYRGDPSDSHSQPSPEEAGDSTGETSPVPPQQQ